MNSLQLLLQLKTRSKYDKNMKPGLELTEKTFSNVFTYSVIIYMFNPYSVMACAMLSSTVFDNILLAATIITTLRGK